MASDITNKSISATVGSLFFWGFVVVKIAGHSFVDWSWWWVLLPVVPWFGLAVKHWGL